MKIAKKRHVLAAPPGRHVVVGAKGLLLTVTPTGGRSWTLRVQCRGKRRDLGLGGFPTIGLAAARERAIMKRREVKSTLKGPGAMSTSHAVTTLRTGITKDGLLEVQLIYGNERGQSIWFQFTKAQADKLAREIEAMQDAAPRTSQRLKIAE